MRRWIVVCCLLPFVSASGLSATEPPYDLAACIRAALTEGTDLRAAAADLAAARARLAQARAGRYGRSEYTQVLGVVNRARGNPTFSPDERDDYFDGLGPFTRLELDISIPLYTFGKLDAALAAAEAGLQSERARGRAARAEVILNTKQLYYGLLLARQLSAVLHDMLDNLDEAVETTQRRLDAESGSVTDLDLLRLKIGRARFAKGVLEVDASAALTRSALARTIGVEDDATFDIADRRLWSVKADIEPLDDYLATGPTRRPAWQQLVAGIDAQSAQLAVEEAAYYPTFFLSTGLHFARAGNRTEQDNPFAYDELNFIRPIGVMGVHWDLNFFNTAAKVAGARAQLQRLRAQEQAAIRGLRLEIRRAYSDVTQARETIRAAEQGRKAARALLIFSVSNFDLGIGDGEDLFDAFGAYTEASTDYFRAVHDFNVAVATLGRTVGKELTALEY